MRFTINFRTGYLRLRPSWPSLTSYTRRGQLCADNSSRVRCKPWRENAFNIWVSQALRQLSEQDLSTPSAHIRCRWQDMFVEFPLRSSAATCGDALALATFEIIWVFSTQLLNIWGSTFSRYMSLVTFLFCCRRLAREGFTMGALAFNSHLCSDGCTYPQTNCPWSKQRALAGVGIEDPKTLRSLEEGLEASHSVSLLANSVARDREHS